MIFFFWFHVFFLVHFFFFSFVHVGFWFMSFFFFFGSCLFLGRGWCSCLFWGRGRGGEVMFFFREG